MIANDNILSNLHKTVDSLCIKDNPVHNGALDQLFLSYQYPGLEKKDIKDLILVLWKIDTLGDFVTWSLFHSKGVYSLRTIKLKNKNPYHKLVPDTFGSERSISDVDTQKLITSLSKLSIELVESEGVIIDGVKCGIISNNITVEWWYQTSQTIAHLDNWFKETVQKFDSMF